MHSENSMHDSTIPAHHIQPHSNSCSACVLRLTFCWLIKICNVFRDLKVIPCCIGLIFINGQRHQSNINTPSRRFSYSNDELQLTAFPYRPCVFKKFNFHINCNSCVEIVWNRYSCVRLQSWCKHIMGECNNQSTPFSCEPRCNQSQNAHTSMY